MLMFTNKKYLSQACLPTEIAKELGLNWDCEEDIQRCCAGARKGLPEVMEKLSGMKRNPYVWIPKLCRGGERISFQPSKVQGAAVLLHEGVAPSFPH